MFVHTDISFVGFKSLSTNSDKPRQSTFVRQTASCIRPLKTAHSPLKEVRVCFLDVPEPVKKVFKEEKFDKDILLACYEKEDDDEMHFNMAGRDIKFDSADLLKWIVDLFSQAKFGWRISLERFGTEFLEQLYPVPHFNLSYSIDLGFGKLSSSQLKKLMNRLKRLECIFIDSRIPSRFSYKKALSYVSMHYEDARWVKMEDLMLLRSPFDLSLGKTIFDNEDLNRYIKHWKSSQDNLMGRLTLHLRSDVEIDRKAICQDFEVFRTTNQCTILCDNHSERKHPLGLVSFKTDSKQIIFKTLEKTGISYRYEQLILFAEEKQSERKDKGGGQRN